MNKLLTAVLLLTIMVFACSATLETIPVLFTAWDKSEIKTCQEVKDETPYTGAKRVLICDEFMTEWGLAETMKTVYRGKNDPKLASPKAIAGVNEAQHTTVLRARRYKVRFKHAVNAHNRADGWIFWHCSKDEEIVCE